VGWVVVVVVVVSEVVLLFFESFFANLQSLILLLSCLQTEYFQCIARDAVSCAFMPKNCRPGLDQ